MGKCGLGEGGTDAISGNQMRREGESRVLVVAPVAESRLKRGMDAQWLRGGHERGRRQHRRGDRRSRRGRW